MTHMHEKVNVIEHTLTLLRNENATSKNRDFDNRIMLPSRIDYSSSHGFSQIPSK